MFGLTHLVHLKPANNNDNSDVHTKGQVHDVEHSAPSEVKQEVLTFDDASPGQELTFNYIQDPTFNDGAASDSSLSEYFSRPVRIASYVWAEGATLNHTLSPWLEYFDNTYVKRKLDNYGLVRCNLRVKVMINSSPFYYSLAQVAYHPLVNLHGHDIDPLVDPVTRSMILSQRPKIFISPQDSAGGELLLPFFHFKNWMRVNNRQEFIDMGTLDFNSFTELRNSNGVAGGNVNVQVFAWAENVSVTAPTAGFALQSQLCSFKEPAAGGGMSCVCVEEEDSEKIVYESQSSSGAFRKAADSASNFVGENGGSAMGIIKNITGTDDEYGKGPVSKVASNIASAAHALETVPFIKPFATATSFAAEATGRIASFFGWSNPPVISDVSAFRTSIFPNLSSPEISNPTEKLTLDPKNELCVDSRTVGLDGTDEMTLASICQRESYLGSFGFTQGNAAGHLLWSAAVTPALSWFDTGTSAHQTTPMGHASQMFRYWRGDVIFRFKFIATQYHNGRVIVSWDPFTDITGITDTETVNYTQVFDLSQGVDVEMRIPYMQAVPFLTVQTLPSLYGATTPFTTIDGATNGALTVRVLNELTAPDASSAIDCAVFVRAADNLEFACPKDLPHFSFFEPQSSLQPFQLQSEVESVRKEVVLTNQDDPVDHLYMSYMGERVKSLRTLLRRPVWSTTIVPITVAPPGTYTASYLFRNTMSRYPLQRGYDPNGVHQTNTSAPYNFTVMHPMSYVSACYIGQRGGTVMHLNPSTTAEINNICIQRDDGAKTAASFRAYNASLNTGNSGFNKTIAENRGRPNISGGSVTNARTASGVQSHIPFYSKFRFDDTDPSTSYVGNVELETDHDSVKISVSAGGDSLAIGAVRYELYIGAGIDYSCFFYLNVPLIYEYIDPASSGSV